MYQINLNTSHGLNDLKHLIKKWQDNSQTSIPLILVKISEAFSMYHQVSHADLIICNHLFTGTHPVLINDLDTDENILLTLNQNGAILHFYLINNQGRLIKADYLKKHASKTIHQEYLDYFYCIAKNIEGCVKAGNP